MNSYVKTACELSCKKSDLQQLKSLKMLQEQVLNCAQKGQQISFAEGQIVFYEGHFPIGYFILKQGILRLETWDSQQKLKSSELVFPQENRILCLWHHFHKQALCSRCISHTESNVVFIAKSLIL